MNVRRKIYGRRPEYCIVVNRMNEIVYFNEGDLGSVNMDFKYIRGLILANNVKYILHSHPYGYGSTYSCMDKRVFESWAVATGKTILHRITDYREVTDYWVKDTGQFFGVTRQIGLIESLTNQPWGVKIKI